MRKKLLFVTTRLFWPTDSGHKVLLHNYCKGLHEIYGYDVYLYSFLEGGQTLDRNKIPPYIKDVVLANEVPVAMKGYNLVRYSLFGSNRKSFQSAIYYNPKNVERIRKFCEELKPDTVIFDMIRLSQYREAVGHLDCLKVLYMEDILSKRYIRQIQRGGDKSGIAGRFSDKLPSVLNKLINAKGLRNAVLRAETKRVQVEEVSAVKRFDSVIYVNQIEADEMKKTAGVDNGYVVTMGADCDYFGENIHVDKKENTLAFVGNMAYAPNADSVRMIVQNILPLIPSKPTIHFIGNCPSELRQEFEGHPQCVFEGLVDDVRESVKSAIVVLSPIAYGTGVKTKVIEGMAMSMPVVTNSLGVEGLSVQVGRDLLMSDDYGEIATMVEELLHNPEKCAELGRNGHDYTMKNHRWEDIYKVFGQAGL